MEGVFVGMFAVIGLFFVCPLALLTYLRFHKKMKTELQKLEYQKDILAMELQKEQLVLERMALENKMLDRKIDQIEKS